MTTTRNKRTNNTPTLADLEGATNPVDTPAPLPPPGIPARIRTTIDYDRPIDPNNGYSDDLRALAAEEIEDDSIPIPDVPADPLTDFCNTWRNYVGYTLRVVRLPDPANKRIPGQTFNTTCFEVTALGGTPFEPNGIVQTLQLLNNNSGGAFRLLLGDENGQLIPGARLDRILIPDPPKDPREYNPRGYNPYSEDPRYYRQREPQPAPAPPPQKSETELYIEQMQRELFQKVMMRALDPPATPAPDPLSALSPDDRLALGLLQRGDILETAVSRIANLAQAPDRIESATWKDKLADAGIQLVTHNPQIVATITDIVSRATVALASAFAPRAQQVINEPLPVHNTQPRQPQTQQIPQRAPAPLPPRALDGLPETSQPIDHELDADEDIEIDMMEEIIKLLLSDKPLDLNDPVIQDIRAEYPAIFDAAMAGITTMPSATVIQYLCAKSEFCADMFNSSVTGPHLKQRLEELKTLLAAKLPANAQNPNITSEAPTTATE